MTWYDILSKDPVELKKNLKKFDEENPRWKKNGGDKNGKMF